MSKYPLPGLEASLAICGIALGIIVSLVLAPEGASFTPNVLFFWVPQLSVILLLCLFRPRKAAIAGVAGILAAYLWIFHAFILSHPDGEGLVWLGYLFSFPGAALGAVVAALWLRKQQSAYSIIATLFIAAGFESTGILVNQTIVCHTILYCRW